MSILPTKILLATDGSEDAALAARAAVDLSGVTNSELHVVAVAERAPEYDVWGIATSGTLRHRAKELLNEQVERIEEIGGVTKAHLKAGRPDAEILALGEELGAGLIVIGSRGRGGVRRALMGDVSDSVVRHAHCPVMVVRRGERVEEGVFPARILVATDGSRQAELAASTAADLAAETRSELHVVHVFRIYSSPDALLERGTDLYKEHRQKAQRLLDRQVRKMEETGTEVASVHLREGKPDAEIVALAEDLGAGLILVGSSGLGGVKRTLMGSVSDSVVRHAHCPVIVVRPEDR